MMQSLSESPGPLRPTTSSDERSTILTLVLGDLLAFVIFVSVGRLSHGLTSDWLINVARIATPFLLGWAVAALLLGVYRPRLLRTPTRFLLLSAAAVVLGDLIGFGLRAWLFQNSVPLTFALTSVAFTLLFVAGWRGVFVVLFNR
jgi:hypothetical protein